MDPAQRDKAHARMLREIANDAAATARWTGRAAFSGRTMQAMAAVPRHRFVPPELADAAYANRPQRIGHGQTISQPYIVALMTEFLDLDGGETVLEIGAGSGYQAAVISVGLSTGHLHSLEAVAALARTAASRLRELGHRNVTVRHANGFSGCAEAAPFDAIIVTAAPVRIPDRLVRQLAAGGRMILPVGRPGDRQMLTLVRKDRAGRVSADKVLPVAFVPMVDAD